jgi:hypothetical protein
VQLNFLNSPLISRRHSGEFQPMPPLTSHAHVVLSILADAGSAWLNRKAIANLLGKKRLNPYNIATLNFLVQAGCVDIMQQSNHTPIGYEYIYRFRQLPPVRG